MFSLLKHPACIALIVFSIGTVQGRAGAISVNYAGFAFAGAVVPSAGDFVVDGPRIGGTTALAIAFDALNLAIAGPVRTRPPFEIDVNARTVNGVWIADFSDPFVTPIVAGPGVLRHDGLHDDGSFTNPATFSVAGNGSRNANGFLELGVLKQISLNIEKDRQICNPNG